MIRTFILYGCLTIYARKNYIGYVCCHVWTIDKPSFMDVNTSLLKGVVFYILIAVIYK